jgi:hypothetical protein
MRNVSGYLTDDGKFFSDKREAEAHERMFTMNKHIENFINIQYAGSKEKLVCLQEWEKYRLEVTK